MAQGADPAAEPPFNPLTVRSGVKLFVAGVALRHYSPNIFAVETPLLVGGAGNATFVVAVLLVLLLPLLDWLAGPRGAVCGTLHTSAVRWLNSGQGYADASGNPRRRPALIASAAVALGEEAIFRWALPTLVPPLGPIEDHLPFHVNTGLLISVLAYTWYRSGDGSLGGGSAHGLAAACFGVAAKEGGLIAAVALNFCVSVGMVSFYFHARVRAKRAVRSVAASPHQQGGKQSGRAKRGSRAVR